MLITHFEVSKFVIFNSHGIDIDYEHKMHVPFQPGNVYEVNQLYQKVYIYPKVLKAIDKTF